MLASSFETYTKNTKYTLYIIMQYTVPKDGYIILKLPEQVFVETQPTVKIYKGYTTSTLSI
jgi:hypothetical protein